MDPIKQNVDDVEFVCSELVRFIEMGVEGVRAHWRERPPLEAFYMIGHPSGRGQLFIGKDAYARFDSIARRHLAAHSTGDARVGVDPLARALRKEFSTRFLRDELDVNQVTVEAMVDAAWQRVVASFEERTHYIPCSIIEETDPEEFVVGPVQFIRAELFLQRHGQEIEGERKVISEELTQRWKRGRNEFSASEPAEVAAAKHAEHLFGNVEHFFKSYGWVAMVKVGSAERDTSRARATAVLQATLDVLKLLMGANHSNLVGISGNAIPAIRTASMFRDSQGRLHPGRAK